MLQLKPSVGWCCRPQHHGDRAPRSITLLLYYSLGISLLFLYLLTNQLIITPIQAQVVSVSQPVELAQQPSTPEPTVAPTETPVLPSLTAQVAPPTLVEQHQPIKDYISTIFGRNGATAYAIAFAESGKRDENTGKPYFRTTAINSSNVELSVGVFQINLKNSSSKVHYDRIPGHSLDEKVKWLQNPYQNVLFAYWVYSTSGFWPWSTYSDGKYLAFMK